MQRRVVLVVLMMLVVAAQAQYQPRGPPETEGFAVREELAGAGDLEGAVRIVRFVQVSDAHIIDDDAPYPMRQGILDQVFGPVTSSAERPQEEYTDEVLDSIVQAINELHGRDGLDFVINTGDNIDNQLENELMRFIDNWRGTHTTVGPVSGLPCVPDGPSESLDDDSNDETMACTSLPSGLAENNTALAPTLPWYSAFGNHDGLIQGNVPVEPSFQEIANEFGRYFLPQHQYVGMHFLAGGQCAGGVPAGVPADHFGQGYGFAGDRLCDDDPDNDGYYAFSLRGVRFIVLDTVNDDFVTGNSHLAGLFPPTQTSLGYDTLGGYAEGSVDPAQYAWLQRELATHGDQLIMLFSHHTVNSMFTNQGAESCAPGVGCLEDLLHEAGYVTGPQLIETLNEHANVMAWIGGHTHQHRIETKLVEGAPGGFWNIESSSLIDFPQEARAIELWQAPDGKAFLRLERFGHDFQPSKDLEATDPQRDPGSEGGAGDQDVLLWFEVPQGVVLTPQPALPLDMVLRAGALGGGVVGVPFTFQVAITDSMIGAPVRGLDVTVQVHRTTGTEAVDVVAAGTAMTEVLPGTYVLEFTPDGAATHFATVEARDPAGAYPDAVQVFSIPVEGEPPGKRSPGPGVLVTLALVGLVLWRRQNR